MNSAPIAQPTTSITAAPIPQNRKFLALCGAGAFVLLAGLAAPQFLVETPNPETPVRTSESKNEKVKPAPREAVAKELDPTKVTEPPSMTGILVRLMLGTFVVLVLCGGTAWGIGRWVRSQQNAQTTGPLKLVASLSVNRTVRVHLVQIGDQQIILGTDATGLKSMIPLNDSFETQLEETQIQEAHGIPIPRMMQ